MTFLSAFQERSACGVGFIASRTGQAEHSILSQGLDALCHVEHRGACLADQKTGDGSGIMADIPFDLLGYQPGTVAAATLFLRTRPRTRQKALDIVEKTFDFMGLPIVGLREVPTDPSVLGPQALETLPELLHVFFEWPAHCRTDESLNRLLYLARQKTRTRLKNEGIDREVFFASLSTRTIIYKALTRAKDLRLFYPDLSDPAFKSRFTIFHRRFSTNTRTSWDKAQPFRLIAHNGEINTIAGNHSWAYSREHTMGLPADELLTHNRASDSKSLNEMVEALKYRSSIPKIEDILAIMIPPPGDTGDYYRFWSRAMEPWDGPAFINYSDGEVIGARLDRNGFRPCRWTMTEDRFYLASESGLFPIEEKDVLAKGTLRAGSGMVLYLDTGIPKFRDPSQSRKNSGARFSPRLVDLPPPPETGVLTPDLSRSTLFRLTKEEYERVLIPMMTKGKEGIGSMGDTARLAILSTEPRSFFDYFYQTFAQVTNPPLDYLRERVVTDLSTYIGKRPNIFAPKELIPPTSCYFVDSPVLTPRQLESIELSERGDDEFLRLRVARIDCSFERASGVSGFQEALGQIASRALDAVKQGCRVLILGDRESTIEKPPLPSLLALRSVVQILNLHGLRLECSVVVDTADARTPHQVACLLGFGATAVCPYLAFDLAAEGEHHALKDLSVETKCRNLQKAFDDGLLKIMSKMGISVVKSYQSAKLFTAVGLDEELLQTYFPGLASSIGGLSIRHVAEKVLRDTSEATNALNSNQQFLHTYQLKEHNKGLVGEKHSMTSARSRILHKLIAIEDPTADQARQIYAEYLKDVEKDEPIHIRHLFDLKRCEQRLDLSQVQSVNSVMSTFGAGAMSFGAISAESQRDIFLAMRKIGGRSNSGEGGENPYYYSDGISASTKQVASGRFGVTAEYLVTGNEIEIKVAQGAKPGEGGQLMGVKVNADIARARHSLPNVDLISPPPLHDIYSIEDLKELIFELKQLAPDKSVCVKLVSGVNIGTIAVGVVKAGADVIQISGGDGGTGAATLGSMRHAGLPWELGLIEVNRTLEERALRKQVRLRVDGALTTGKDVVIGAILGADEFGFGKLMLIAEGCIMARICEKNTCPRGIATHDPKFKAKYRGKVEEIERLFHHIAQDIREHLASLGARSLDEVRGKTEYLAENLAHSQFISSRGLTLGPALHPIFVRELEKQGNYQEPVTPLNEKIVEDVKSVLEQQSPQSRTFHYNVCSTDRAVLARLSGFLGERQRDLRSRERASTQEISFHPFRKADFEPVQLNFRGTAGQGFGVFLCQGVDVMLEGEANDSVCKSMSGGKVTLKPPQGIQYHPKDAAIIGNCALYGATGGTLYTYGKAGDRFAVRNSGATAVVESVGMHSCGYMTGGTVLILGEALQNIGGGMTGGVLFTHRDNARYINEDYLVAEAMSKEDEHTLLRLLEDYTEHTQSETALAYLSARKTLMVDMVKYVPHAMAQHQSDHVPEKARDKPNLMLSP